MNCKAKLVSILLFVNFLISTCAAQSIIKKEISLSKGRVKLQTALDELALKGEFKISYNAAYFPSDSMVNKLEGAQTVENHLASYFKRAYLLKENGLFLIILPNKKKKPQQYIISGYVVDQYSKKSIPNATVYDPNKYASTLTNQLGRYDLEVKASNEKIAISISKENYCDTVFFVPTQQGQPITTAIKPITIETAQVPQYQTITPTSHLEQTQSVKLLVPSIQVATIQNINYFLNRPTQISFIPAWGSNRKLNGVVNNYFSINVLSGYSAGVNGLEIAGLLNMNRYQMNGLQMSGIGNLVGQKVIGFQAGGIFNHVKGPVLGLQMAGIYNKAQDTLMGLQAAGIYNHLKGQSIGGVQMAGLLNVSNQDFNGFQVSGLINSSKGNVSQFQIAGLVNKADTVEGGQISGLINSASSVKNIQLAGLVNVAKERVKGLQMSGLINIAKQMDGVQFGVFNFAKNGKGVSIGLFSHFSDGYQSLGISSTEVTPLAISYQTGVLRFYNIFSVGVSPKFWGYSYGFGGQKYWGKYLGRVIEANFWQLHGHENMIFDTNILSRFSYLFSFKKSRFTVHAGPVYSWQILNKSIPEAEVFAPYKYSEFSFGNTLFAHWPGFQVKMQFEL